MSRLTTKQLQIFNFIYSYIFFKKISPTYREIAKGCNLTQYQHAYAYVQKLKSAGYITQVRGKPQSIGIIRLPKGAIQPSAGVPFEDVEYETNHAAYMRGVAVGKAILPEEILKSEYQRGYRAGTKHWPADIEEAYKRGFVAGREEAKKDLRLVQKNA